MNSLKPSGADPRKWSLGPETMITEKARRGCELLEDFAWM
jgi:hypothetical protein